MALEEQLKIVLLGEGAPPPLPRARSVGGAVGKTSICLRYVQNQFNDKHLTTIQASFFNKRVTIDGRRVMLNVWDTAGQERFHALSPIYYRDSNGALLVYDITDVDSFKKVQNWVKELRKMLGTDIAVCIAGNKIDMERSRTVDNAEAEAYAASVGAKHFLVSAKLDKGLQELFLQLTRDMLALKKKDTGRGGGGGSKLLIVDDDAPAGGKAGGGGGTGCCG